MSNSRLRVVFFGTPLFARVQLRALLKIDQVSVVAVITQPDRPAGRGQKLVASPVKELALESGIRVLQPISLRKEIESVEEFAQITGGWDIGVVAAYGLIVPQKILDLPKHGCVNVHASLLPRWRGAAPIHRAIIEGDAETGVCLMRMEAGLDTGPVFAERRIGISENETTGLLHDKLAKIGAEMLTEHLLEIVAGSLKSVEQSQNGVTYAEKISKEEAEIKWSEFASKIARVIRGLNPAPGAFTVFGSDRVKIWSACQIPTSSYPLTPGELRSDGESLYVGCGENSILQILELQPAGRKRISAAEYLRGLGASQLPKSVTL